MHVFVEWNFLDFDNNICVTKNLIKLPRNQNEICNFNTEQG